MSITNIIPGSHLMRRIRQWIVAGSLSTIGIMISEAFPPTLQADVFGFDSGVQLQGLTYIWPLIA